ncbi:hypothetical protein L873DRAFT_1848695 [Choiromyces venosus 120613-1]|uniref:Uncharacterized protein n=1 Tax=Choiromyces venosus 120613-1 TaxID=1336337 RepID=A0A3N4J230_9PEZI|nr:hypothetical protein L873DRAFT_1848695 [Choiromyces venosus 120613-1]
MAAPASHLEDLFNWILKNVTPEDMGPDNKIIINYDGFNTISIGDQSAELKDDQKETFFCIRTPKFTNRCRKASQNGCNNAEPDTKGKGKEIANDVKEEEEGEEAEESDVTNTLASEYSDDSNASEQTKIGHTISRTLDVRDSNRFIGAGHPTPNGGDTNTSSTEMSQNTRGSSLDLAEEDVRTPENEGSTSDADEIAGRRALNPLHLSAHADVTRDGDGTDTFGSDVSPLENLVD